MESITISEIYKNTENLKLATVITHYFLLYIVLYIIQAALRVEVALIQLQISRRILTGALLVLLYLYGYSFFGHFSFFYEISVAGRSILMVSILVLFILLFRAFLLFVISPLTFLVLVIIKVAQSLRGKQKTNSEAHEIAWEAIVNLLKSPGHRDNVSLYWQYHVLNFSIVFFLAVEAFKEGIQLGYLMSVIGGYFMYLGFKERSARNWKRKTSLSKDQLDGYIKIKTLPS